MILISRLMAPAEFVRARDFFKAHEFAPSTEGGLKGLPCCLVWIASISRLMALAQLSVSPWLYVQYVWEMQRIRRHQRQAALDERTRRVLAARKHIAHRRQHPHAGVPSIRMWAEPSWTLMAVLPLCSVGVSAGSAAGASPTASTMLTITSAGAPRSLPALIPTLAFSSALRRRTGGGRRSWSTHP